MDKQVIQEALNVIRGMFKNLEDKIDKQNNNDIVSAVKSIPQPNDNGVINALEVVRDSIVDALDREVRVDVKAGDVQVDVDNSDILRELRMIKPQEIKFPQIPDNIRTLEKIVAKLDNIPQIDLKPLEKAIKGIKSDTVVFPKLMDVDLDPNLIEDKQVKVKLSDKQLQKLGSSVSSGGINASTLIDKLVGGDQKTQIVDSAGNVIDAEADHLSKYHLAVTVNQDVNADPNNTSSDNLNAGATFTGTVTSTLGVVGLQWSLYTTQNCTVYVDESPDGTNWDISYSFDYLASQGGRGETVQATQAYWRIRVTNIGAIATTTFRLQGVLCPVAVPLPSSLSETGRLKVQNENQFIEIPRGRINGYSVVNKFGANSNVDAGATEEIWDGNRVYVFPTTASITHIRTEADTAAMDGMVVEIQGLDTNYDLVVQNATIDAGTSTATEVELGTPLRRVYRMKVLSSVVTTNAIWVGATGMSAATANGIIQAGNNQTLMAIYTVPAGKTGYMTQWRATVNPATGKDPTSMPIKMWARDNANNYAKQLKDIQGLIVGTLRVPYEPYYKFTEKTDIYFTASPVGKAADVSVGFDLILVDNQ